MFPGTFVISMAGLRDLADALDVTVDWLVENLPFNFIEASDVQSSDNFGWSVDVSSDGTRAVIGAYAEDTRGDNAGAAYIFARDEETKTWTEEQILYASNSGASDNFGYSVSINRDGSKVAIGAQQEDANNGGTSNSGAVYVYSRVNTTWSEDQILRASDPQDSAQFGRAVDISEDGTYIIVGAQYYDITGTDGQGVAYIFKYSNGTWSEEQKLQAGEYFSGGSGAGYTPNDYFGVSVSIDYSGQVVIVGALNYDVTGTNAEGGAFIFKNSPSVITVENQQIGPNENEDQQYFGYATDISGDRSFAAISAYQTDAGATSNVGAVYLLKDSNGTWIHDQKVVASDPQTTAQFGYSVAMSNNSKMIVGARLFDITTGTNNHGAAYIFDYSNGTWSEEQKLQLGEYFNGGSGADYADQDYFGQSVDISDDGLYSIVGVVNDDVGGQTAAGSAAVFKYEPTTIVVENQQIGPSVNEAQQYFGYATDMSADAARAIVGAYQTDNGATSNTGAVYFLENTGGTWVHDQILRASDPQDTAQLGWSVAMSNDGNYAIAGARLFDITTGTNNHGAAYIFKYSGGTWSEEQKLQLGEYFNGGSGADYADQNYFGQSVDISSNGEYAVVGVVNDDVGGQTHAGTAAVFKNEPSSITVENQQIGPSENEAQQYFGYATDISGDGTRAIVGAYTEDAGGTTNSGAVYFLEKTGGTWSEEQKVIASDPGGSDQFGKSVAMSKDGNTVIVGSPFDDATPSNSGSAYILSYSGSTWSQDQKLTASDAGQDDAFGQSVDISGNGEYAIIGAYLWDVASTNGEGAAYIFKDSGGTWVEKQRITASNAGAGDRFGFDVAISNDGTKVIVGALEEDTKGTNAGAAYVFSRSGETWTQDQIILASDGAGQDDFGASVDIDSSGEYIVVGARGDGGDAGAAYVFKDSAGTFVEKQKLTASDTLQSDRFGFDVSISDSSATVLIGADRKDYKTYSGSSYTTVSDAGAAYVFTESDGTWVEHRKIQASDAQSSDYFATSVALAGNAETAIVGAYTEDTGADNNGRMYSYDITNFVTEDYPIIWRQKAILTASNAGTGDDFGWDVAIDSDGTTIIVGAPMEDTKGTNAGAAYVFSRSGETWTQDQIILASDGAGQDDFGISVDITGDGTKVIVGARGDGGDAGAAYIFDYSGSTWSQDQKLTASDTLTTDRFGHSVKFANNGSSVLVGADRKDYKTYSGSNYTTVSDAGAAYVFTESNGTWTELKKIQASDAQSSDYFATSVAIDGAGDMALIGAYTEDTGADNNGRVYSYNISADSEQLEDYPIIWRQKTILTASNAGNGDDFGWDVAVSKNGSVAIVGAPMEDTNGSNAGAAYVFKRSGETWTQDQIILASDGASLDDFGISVDITQDGNYVIVGARGDGGDTGAAYIFKDSDNTWVEKQKLTVSDAATTDRFGYSVSADSDGTYFVIGADRKDYKTYSGSNYTTVGDAGAAYVFKNVNGTWTELKKIQASDAQSSDYFGTSVSISNDGTKVIVGAYTEDTGADNNGRVYSYDIDNFATADYPIIWRQEAILTASDAQAGDDFGWDVSLSDDGLTAVVGAPMEDTNGSNAGAAYVFKDVDGTWTQDQRLIGSDTQALDRFGHGVDISGNSEYIIVGAYGEDTGGSSAGAAYVFKDSDGTWVEKRGIYYYKGNGQLGRDVSIDSDGSVALIGASNDNGGRAVIYDFEKEYAVHPALFSDSRVEIQPAGVTNNDFTGGAVAVSNDGTRVAVGIDNDFSSSSTAQNVTVFRESDGSWVEEATLTGSDTGSYHNFGATVSFDSDASTIIIGANYNGDGAAYVFSRTGTSWSEDQKLTVNATDDFGWSVSMSADAQYAVVGAKREDVGGVNEAGAAYVFKDSDGTWVEKQRLTASGTLAIADHFGDAANISDDGNYIIIGSRQADVSGNANEGAAFVFKRSGETWSEEQKLTASDGVTTDNFANSVVLSAEGDYAVVGSPMDDGTNSNIGAVYIYTRSGSTWSQTQKIQGPDTSPTAHHGWSVDMSADGEYIIAGARRANGDDGRAFVYKKNGSTWSQINAFTNGATDGYFGSAVAISANANVAVVGEPRNTSANVRGKTYIYSTWDGS